jgi:hypothetical protein
MINEKELLHILLATITLVFVVAFKDILASGVNYITLGILFLFIALIILVNVLAKKATAHYYAATLEIKTWNWQRFGFARQRKLKKPLPMGIIAPILTTLITQGNFLFLATLESKIEGTSARATKAQGRFRFTEMTDTNQSLIIASGVVANLALAILAYLIDLGQLATLSIYYATYAMIPFGNLDGTKIFFGERNLWFTLAIITAIFLSFALLIPR